jgi:hypothetical protein
VRFGLRWDNRGDTKGKADEAGGVVTEEAAAVSLGHAAVCASRSR